MTDFDPFADNAPNPEAAAPETNTTIPTPKKETTVSNSNQSKIVVTLKGGSGYDAPWIVVHADDVADATATLNDPAMKDLIEKSSEVGKFFAEKGTPARSNAGGKPAGAAQAPNGQTPPEGYTFKSGVGKTGRPWKAFMPIDRNSGLEVIWL